MLPVIVESQKRAAICRADEYQRTPEGRERVCSDLIKPCRVEMADEKDVLEAMYERDRVQIQADAQRLGDAAACGSLCVAGSAVTAR
jgi:hypothetical protein